MWPNFPMVKFAGWIGAQLFRSVETDSFAEISGLVVAEGNLSRGFGKLLLDTIEQWVRRIDCEVIAVRSNAVRQRAHRFYRNNGYELVKTQKIFRKNL
jgi:GNAT superfamily N-acetyltransferase